MVVKVVGVVVGGRERGEERRAGCGVLWCGVWEEGGKEGSCVFEMKCCVRGGRGGWRKGVYAWKACCVDQALPPSIADVP